MDKSVFRTDANRAFCSKVFLIGTIGIAVAAFLGVFDQVLSVYQGTYAETGLEQGFVIQLVFSALSSKTVLLVLPILSAIPFTTAFLDDYKTRFFRQYLPRARKKNYVTAKVIVTAISGGLTLFLGIIVVLILFVVLFRPLEVPPEEPEETSAYETQVVESEQTVDVTSQQNLVTLLSYAFVFFLCGCLWSLVGALLAVVTMSKYMAYASPFILYYLLVIISERYFKKLYVLNPQEWMNPAAQWPGGIWGVALLVSELIIAVGFLYRTIMERKLQDA